MLDFIPGLELSHRFYGEAVRPILDERMPSLAHAAALIGPGSDVLGFDTEMSTDHDWGPRVLIFLCEADAAQVGTLDRVLRTYLPTKFMGYAVARNSDSVADANGHRVDILTVNTYVKLHLAFDLDQPLEPADWLTFPAQKLLELTSGEVFHDGIGELTALRERFGYYPRDVWLYLIAATWQRIGQEEHLMPRAGFVGDELGSVVIGSRLVRDAINLAFLLERQYPPYPKWLGMAFARLRCAKALSLSLWQAQRALSWRERQTALGHAFATLAGLQNDLEISPRMPPIASGFHGRPFRVINGGTIALNIVDEIVDPKVRAIAEKRLIGGIDQFSDNTDLLAGLAEWRTPLRKLFE